MGAAPHPVVADRTAPATGGRVRVLLVDDSPTVRAVFGRLITSDPDLTLAAAESSAEGALAALKWAKVDVIVLDLDMPGMGGLQAIPKMLEVAAPARILVVSARAVRGAEQTLAALSLGAADTLAKPAPGEFDDAYRALLVRKLRLLGRVAVRAHATGEVTAVPRVRSHRREVPHVLAIGASTGGIHAICQMLAALPPRLALPILVTQHLPGAFTPAFVRQLVGAGGRGTLVAHDGMALLPGQIVVAPGDAHLTVAISARGPAVVRLDRAPSVSGCRPSLDPMFASCAAVYGRHALGVVLSGMGRDGIVGAERIVAGGGTMMAQDAASSAVWGMPGAVAHAGLASAILPPRELAARIVAAVDAR